VDLINQDEAIVSGIYLLAQVPKSWKDQIFMDVVDIHPEPRPIVSQISTGMVAPTQFPISVLPLPILIPSGTKS
jgi:hypothetical protein